MSERERQERFNRAVHEGKRAYRRGDSRDSCPYKKSMWGMGGAWDMGYSRAMNEQEAHSEYDALAHQQISGDQSQ